MGDINVSTMGVYDNGLSPQSDNLRYGVGLKYNQSLFSNGNSSVNLGISAQGYIPLKGKAALEIDFRQKVSPNLSIGAGLEGTFSIQKSKSDTVTQTEEHYDNRSQYSGYDGPYNENPNELPKIDTIICIPENGDSVPEEGNVLIGDKKEVVTEKTPNKQAAVAGKVFAKYDINNRLSFTAGVKAGKQYDLGGTINIAGNTKEEKITSSELEYVNPPESGFADPASYQYKVDTQILESNYSSSAKNNDNRFRIGLFGEADYKVNDSLKIGAFGDAFHKEAGVKVTFTL